MQPYDGSSDKGQEHWLNQGKITRVSLSVLAEMDYALSYGDSSKKVDD